MSVPLIWSTTPSDNQTVDPAAQWPEGQPASSLNNSARGMMARLASARDDGTGTLTATVSASNVYTLNTNQSLIDPTSTAGGGTARISKPFVIRAVLPAMPALVATSAPTIVIDGAAAVPLKRRDGSALADGDLNGAPIEILGDGVTNGAYGRARILNLLPSDVAGLIPQQGVQTSCLLSYVSPTQLLLKGEAGTKITINGAAQPVPAGGVSLSNAGLPASTLLYLYAFMSGTTMALEAVTTGLAVDPATGMPVKTGTAPAVDATRTLVGATLTTASGTFQGGAATLSYFNRRDVSATTGEFSVTTNSSSWTLLSGSLMYGLCWADESIDAEYTGSGGITAQNAGVYANMRTVIGDVGVTTPQLYGPQSKAGGNNFVVGGLASRVVKKLGAVTAFAVWAQGFGDAGQSVGYTLSGTLKTRG